MLEILRKPFKKILQPIAQLLVRLHLSANAVTIIGTIGVIISAIYTGISGHLFIGALLMTFFVLWDALDGSVAHITHNATNFGAFLDSSLDRVADWAMIACVDIWFIFHTDMNQISNKIGFIVTTFVFITSFLTSYIRARAEAVGYEAKKGIATRSDRILIILSGLALTGLGLPSIILMIFMCLLAIMSSITVIQRIAEVYKQSLVATS